jgi:hypothetical protein
MTKTYDLALFVKPRRRLPVVKDDPDNRILECALAGRAEAIVTGDRACWRFANMTVCASSACATIWDVRHQMPPVDATVR